MQQLMRMRDALARLRRDRRGLAVIEYAITLPVLLLLGLGGIEVAHYAIATLRISQIAMTTADNAGRVRDQITEADINELMAGAKFVGNGIDFANNGRIILSDLEQSTVDTTKQWIRWQRCTGALNVPSSYGTPLNNSGGAVTDLSNSTLAPSDYGAVPNRSTMTQMGPAGNQIAASPGTAVMVVEVVYNYQPIVSNRWLGIRQMRYVSAFNVRQRTDQTLKRVGLTTAQLSDCTRFAS